MSLYKMQTKITELFNIKYPIIQGGMHYVGFAELAAAVSNAGGLGIITALTQPSADDLKKEILKCKELTDNPIGVNLTFLPSLAAPDYPAYIQAIIDCGVKIVETAGRNPEPYMEYFKNLVAKSISDSAPFNSDKIIELLEYPDKTNRGDISLPCFTLSKKLNPGNVAINLRKKITLPKQIERCEVMGPYLNFFIKKEELTKRVSKDIRSKTSKYGSTNLGTGETGLY